MSDLQAFTGGSILDLKCKELGMAKTQIQERIIRQKKNTSVLDITLLSDYQADVNVLDSMATNCWAIIIAVDR